MKKRICMVLAVLMLLPVFFTAVFAAGHGHGRHERSAGLQCVNDQICTNNADCISKGADINNCRYIDENGDNICDHCKNQCTDCGTIMDANCERICSNCGKQLHCRDNDSDGTRDQQAESARCKNASNPTGTTKGHHRKGCRNPH